MFFTLQPSIIQMDVTRIANLQYFEFANAFHSQQDRHNFCELLYVDSGEIRVKSDNFEGTLCEKAEVAIEHIKPKLKCSECGELFEKKLLSFDCPKCGGQGGPTDIGKEFYIESIEIE